MKRNSKKFIELLFAVLTIMTLIMSLTVPAYAVNLNKDIYLKLDGIEGESTDSKHIKWLDIISFEHSSSQSVQTGIPDVSGRGVFDVFTIVHKVDKTTPKFQEACMKGTRISNAELNVCRVIAGAQTVIYKVKFEGLKVVNARVYVEEYEDGTYATLEEVKFLTSKQTWTASTISIDNENGGNIEASYDPGKASMFDSGSTLTSVIIGAAAFVVIAVVLVIVLTKNKKKKQAIPANAVSNSGTEN